MEAWLGPRMLIRCKLKSATKLVLDYSGGLFVVRYFRCRDLKKSILINSLPLYPFISQPCIETWTIANPRRMSRG
jgi:hypothetical protein